MGGVWSSTLEDIARPRRVCGGWSEPFYEYARCIQLFFSIATGIDHMTVPIGPPKETIIRFQSLKRDPPRASAKWLSPFSDDPPTHVSNVTIG